MPGYGYLQLTITETGFCFATPQNHTTKKKKCVSAKSSLKTLPVSVSPLYTRDQWWKKKHGEWMNEQYRVNNRLDGW